MNNKNNDVETVAQKGVYWYFRFSDNFFDDLEIIRMQTLPGSMGYEFLVILLKLYCRSTKQGGFLKIRTATTGGIDYRVIATAIKHQDVDAVKAAIIYFLEVGLLQIVEAVDYTTFLVPGVQNNIGKSSKNADRMRRIRAEENKAELETENKDLLPPPQNEKMYKYGLTKNIELSPKDVQELCEVYENADVIINEASAFKTANGKKVKGKSDIEIVKQIAQKRGIKQSTDKKSDVPCGIFNNVRLTAAEWEKLCKEFADPKGLIDYISQRIYSGGYVMPSHYAFAVKVGREDGWQTLGERLREEQVKEEEKLAEQAKKDEQIYNRYYREAMIGCKPPAELIEALGIEAYNKLCGIAEAVYQKERAEKE